jgi:cation transport ATPase
VIRQNIAFALALKAIAIAAIFPGWLTLWLAVLCDMGATILVTLNGMRLLTEEPVAHSHGERFVADHPPAAAGPPFTP